MVLDIGCAFMKCLFKLSNQFKMPISTKKKKITKNCTHEAVINFDKIRFKYVVK